MSHRIRMSSLPDNSGTDDQHAERLCAKVTKIAFLHEATFTSIFCRVIESLFLLPLGVPDLLAASAPAQISPSRIADERVSTTPPRLLPPARVFLSPLSSNITFSTESISPKRIIPANHFYLHINSLTLCVERHESANIACEIVLLRSMLVARHARRFISATATTK